MLPRGREIGLKPSLGCWKALGYMHLPRGSLGRTKWLHPWNSKGHYNTLTPAWTLQHPGWEGHPVPLTTAPTGDLSSDELWYLLESFSVSGEGGKGEGVQTGKTIQGRQGSGASPCFAPHPCQRHPRFSLKNWTVMAHHISQRCVFIPNALSIMHFSVFQYLSYGFIF